MVSPAHLRARPGDIAEFVIACGDSARTQQLARLLTRSRLVSSSRGFATYSGYYRKRRVTISTHGIGGPSAAIVFEELRMLGAKEIVRLGTTGALVRNLVMGDFVVPTAAACEEGSLPTYIRAGATVAIPDLSLTKRIIRKCESERVNCNAGLIVSSDSFYGEDRPFLEKWVRRGAISVEMECATLFTLGQLRGFGSASLLIVSNNRVKGNNGKLASDETLRPYVKKGGRIILDVLTTRAWNV